MKTVKVKKSSRKKSGLSLIRNPLFWLSVIVASVVLFYSMGSFAQAETDSRPPTVEIVYPTSKLKIVPNMNLEITARATDNVGVSNVRILVLLQKKASGSSAVTLEKVHECIVTTEPYICPWTVPSGRNLTYLTQAVAQDAAGNTKISKYVQFIVR